MLSAEQRQYVDTFKYRNGMLNIAFISGFARYVTPRGGFIQQTRNENQMIPFVVERGDTVPGWVREHSIVKVVGRIYGMHLKDVGQRICVLRVLRFEVPSILELPPEDAWQHSVPQGAPRSEFEPKFGQYGLSFTKSSNDVAVAGFVSGVVFRPGGVPDEQGRTSNPSLIVLLQQSKNPDEAIPVRLYGRLTPAHARKIKVGSPLKVKDGELRVDVKPTGEVGEGGIATTMKYPFIKSPGLFVADRDDIMHKPGWAEELAMSALKRRDVPTAVEGPADAAAGLQPPTPAAPVDADTGPTLELSEEQRSRLAALVGARPGTAV